MPDITMCMGSECPLKEKCYRFTATPLPDYQSWFVSVNYNPETSKCSFFMTNERNKQTNDNGRRK